MLVNVIGRDGNILWNIAPDKNGKLSQKILDRMTEFGAWVKLHSEAIYSTRGGPLEPVDGVYVSTFRDNNVYLFILDKQRFSELSLTGLPGNVISVSTLFGKPVPWLNADGLNIDISRLPDEAVPVIRVSLDRTIKPVSSEVYFTGRQ
jgi:alpha-L-fucosidase